MADFEKLEKSRIDLQVLLDGRKSKTERNRLGQFATPSLLAKEVISTALLLLPPRSQIRFLDPAFGTGSFFSALMSLSKHRISTSAGFEIDPHYGNDAKQLWSSTKLNLRLADFTNANPPEKETEKFNLVVCNPPYVRHHHMTQDEKRRLQKKVAEQTGCEFSGLSGLYCYFLALSRTWMTKNGLGVWLIPSEFMDVNYGAKVKRFLLEGVSLVRIHRFDPSDVQFGDALVSSAVVFFRNSPPPKTHQVQFTFGGTIDKPRVNEFVPTELLSQTSKWTSLPHNGEIPAKRTGSGTLSDLFKIKRGIATGCNKFFVMTPEQAEEYEIPKKFLKPILPSPRDIENDEILSDHNGYPKLSKTRFLLDCNLPESVVKEKHPALWRYLQIGVDAGVNQGYLCQHREPWYSQEHRPPAPFLCTYMGRSIQNGRAPFRFILNHSTATAANVYLLLFPKPTLASLMNDNPELEVEIWKALNSLTAKMLSGEGRIYGGGLHKLEPKELANVPSDSVLTLIDKYHLRCTQRNLFQSDAILSEA